MSKRKTCEEDLEHLMRKVRKLERKILKSKAHQATTSSSSDGREPQDHTQEDDVTYTLEPDDWLQESPGHRDTQHLSMPDLEQDPGDLELTREEIPQEIPTPVVQPSTSTVEPPSENSLIDLDTDVLAILGDDPSNTVRHGQHLREELACRLQHIVTEGLTKDNRKDLMAKYLTPGNCILIGAPKINPEIKAAIPEAIAKRDKGIETKQGQMASAISCLAEVISAQLITKDKDNTTLQKLMDAIRLLCDLQHSDSVTRRNFILFTLKKDMKDHISNTKIDSYLFSESLAETLKSARAVTKTGVELKADAAAASNKDKQNKAATLQPLNRRAPASRPPGPPMKNRQPATPRARAPPPPPPAHSSTRSSRHQQSRRRY